jgi:hypothetical protein
MVRNDYEIKKKTAQVAKLGPYILIKTTITAWHKCKKSIICTLSNALYCHLPTSLEIEKGDPVYTIMNHKRGTTLYHNVNGHIVKIQNQDKKIHFGIKPLLAVLWVRMVFKF